MKASKTKLLIADKFLELSESKSPEKISISELIAVSKKNRKTFYYHFMDKNHLIIWIYRYQLGQLLVDNFNQDILVTEADIFDDSCSMYKISDYPYYISNKNGVRSLDNSEFFKILASYFQSKKDYYSRIFKYSDSSIFEDYLYKIYKEAIKKDIKFILGNRHLSSGNINFLSDFYTGAFLSYFIKQVKDIQTKEVRAFSNNFNNILHSSLENEIKEQQLNRIF